MSAMFIPVQSIYGSKWSLGNANCSAAVLNPTCAWQPKQGNKFKVVRDERARGGVGGELRYATQVQVQVAWLILA